MKYFKYILSCILIVGSIATLLANPVELKKFDKRIAKEFTIEAGGTIDISNKYGDVDIETHDDNKVSFVVDIIVEAKDEDRAREIMDQIEIEFGNTDSHVEAETNLNFNNSRSWRKRNESYKINYTVMMPRDVDLELYNKYGNISVTSILGAADIELRYGSGYLQDIGKDLDLELGYAKSFEMGRIGGDLDLEIAYSHFNATEAHDTDIESKYSHIGIDQVSALSVDAKYDQYTIGKASSIDISGKYDNYKIGSCGSFKIDTKYTGVKIESLSQSAEIYNEYGNIEIKELGSQFKKVFIKGKYAGLKINLLGGAIFDIETEYTSVDLPDDIETSYRDKDGNELTLKGFVHDKSAGLIEAYMKYGSLRVRD